MTAASPTAVAAAGAARSVAAARLGALDRLLLATVLLAPITKLYIEPLGRLHLSNVLAGLFIVGFVASWARARSRPRSVTSVRVLGWFFVAFTFVYLAGFVALDEPQERVQFAKGLLVWLVHGGFMVCAAAHLSRGGAPLLTSTVKALLVGCAASALWAFGQLAGLRLGVDIDMELIARLPFSPGNPGSIQYYGGGLYRATGLNLDSNHLGVIMAAPLALSLTWLRGRLRWVAAALFAGALVLTLSRSGMLGAAAALLVLAVHMRARLLAPRALASLLAVGVTLAVGVALFAQLRPDLAQSVILGRLDVQGTGAQAHLRLYSLIPDMLEGSPVFGRGLNSFALLFEQASGGRQGFGPHSHYIRTIVETGIAGFVCFLAFAGWLIARLHMIGGIRAVGIAAALVGTLVGNLFYLTTQILYVDVLFALAAAAPMVLGMGYHRHVMSTGTTAHDVPPAAARRPEDVVLAERDPESRLAGPLAQLGRYWWLILVGALIGLGLGALARGGETTTFQASATVYLGQPVGPNGALLDTISSKAASGIELGTGDEAVQAAADAADVPPARIRSGLTVTAVTSPLASKLPSQPAVMKVTMRDADRDVAQSAAAAIAEHLVEETGQYSRSRIADIEQKVQFYEQMVRELRRANVAAARGEGGEDSAILTTLVSSSLSSAQASLSNAKSELAIAQEVEATRIIDKPVASRVAEAERGTSLVVATLLGALAGAIAAFVLARHGRSRTRA